MSYTIFNRFLYVFFILGLVSCAAGYSSPSAPTFFGAKVVGQYTTQFHNQMHCAWVEGFTNTKSCYCTLTNPLDKNKVFLNVDNYPQLCEKDNVKS